MFFLWESSNNNTSWDISVAFLESWAISETNECLTGVNMRRNQQAQREGKQQRTQCYKPNHITTYRNTGFKYPNVALHTVL